MTPGAPIREGGLLHSGVPATTPLGRVRATTVGRHLTEPDPSRVPLAHARHICVRFSRVFRAVPA